MGSAEPPRLWGSAEPSMGSAEPDSPMGSAELPGGGPC